MAENSKIEWTDHTFNPWWGCTRVSPACKHCYADTWAHRLGLELWGQRADRRFFGDAHWSGPLRWNREAKIAGVRARVFCASMGDVFESRRDLDPWRARLWDLIEATPFLDWLLLTKRPDRIGPCVPWRDEFPQNVWLGTTVENQAWAEKRLPHLLMYPAVVRFVSCEPLLGPLDLKPWIKGLGIDWVIAGGESGHRARPSHPHWFRSVRDQCVANGVPFHFKQWGNWAPALDVAPSARSRLLVDVAGTQVKVAEVGKKAAGRFLDGRSWDELPETRNGKTAGAREARRRVA